MVSDGVRLTDHSLVEETKGNVEVKKEIVPESHVDRIPSKTWSKTQGEGKSKVDLLGNTCRTPVKWTACATPWNVQSPSM